MADEIIVGVFIFLILPEMGVEIPIWTGLLVIALLLAKDFLIAPFVLGGGADKRPEVGPEGLIGRTALVVEDLSPEGVVKLDGELWSEGVHKRNRQKGRESKDSSRQGH